MCGIVGIVNHEFKREQLERAVTVLKHRGPDGDGIYIDQEHRLGFGHTRLSVIDPETGHQPLFDAAGEIVLVCNGEIYDFEPIRSDLELRGHQFSTRSDSEVIIHLYREFGPDFISHLRGEFAFLLFDKRRGTVWAVRDRFGIKPLFFVRDGSRFVFASEAKGIFATGLSAPRIDPTAIRDFLSFVPPDSIFEGVQAVPPGHFLRIDLRGEVKICCYWDLELSQERTPSKSLEEYIVTVRQAFDEAVKLRLRADVPVGVYLSGGVDSAAIAGTASKLTTQPIKAFNLEFSDDERFNEWQPAKRMAEKAGVEFYSVKCDNEVLLQHLEDSLWNSEMPAHNLHGVGKYLLARLAHQHVKVVLTGEGGDETFLGYEYFKRTNASITRQMDGAPARLRSSRGSRAGVKRVIDAIGFVPLPDVRESFSWKRRLAFARLVFHCRHRRRLRQVALSDRLRARVDRSRTDPCNEERRIQYYSIKGILAPYILNVLGDRPEMAHAVEGRTPLLDHRLFEVASQIPDRYKLHAGVEKFVFREAVKERITPEIYETKKWPFSAPPVRIKKGNSPELDRLISRYLSRRAIREAGLFRYGGLLCLMALRRLIFINCGLRRDINSLIFVMLNVQILHALYVESGVKPSEQPNVSRPREHLL